MPIKINGATSGSLTIKAPDTGSDVEVDLIDSLAAKAPSTSPTFTGNVVWSGATLRADTAAVTTLQSTTSGTYTDLATAGPSLTLTTGTKVLVIMTAYVYNSASPGICYFNFAVSGATTRSPSDSDFAMWTSTSNQAEGRFSSAMILTGLTAGSNTFTMKYRQGNGTGYFRDRRITVIDLGS